MCSPEATNGVITWAYSPPSRNSSCMASAATSFSRRPSRTARTAAAVTASASAVASSSSAISPGSLMRRACCMGVSPSSISTPGSWAAISWCRIVEAASMPSRPAVQAAVGQHRHQHLAHEPRDQRALLHDRDGVDLLDPRHHPVDAVALPARAQQDRVLPGHQQRPVEERRLRRDQLGAQVGEVAHRLVFPHQHRVQPGGLTGRLGARDALAAQLTDVDALFVADVELALGEAVHPSPLSSTNPLT